jgi:hypothetical protein
MVVFKLTPVIDFMFSEMLYSSVNAIKKLTEKTICEGSPKVILAP